MKLLEERILKESIVINNDIIKVDSFLNHQIDPILINAIAKDIVNAFKNKKIDKVLTIETSGIAIAYAVATLLEKPMVYAKKSKSAIVDDNVFSVIVKSFTRNTINTVTISKNYLHENENILLIDDFMAEGNAAIGMVELCKQAKCNVIGAGIAIEKAFQNGHEKMDKLSIPVHSCAVIKAFKDNKPIF